MRASVELKELLRARMNRISREVDQLDQALIERSRGTLQRSTESIRTESCARRREELLAEWSQLRRLVRGGAGIHRS